jgi:hypothetical protein
MNALVAASPRGRSATLVALLVAGSVLLTLGFACALPFAAFAAAAAMLFTPGVGAAAILAVWLVNQGLGYAVLGYETDAATLAWGVALAAIALASLAAAIAVLRRVSGTLGIAAAFAAAFVVYEGAVLIGCLTSGACEGLSVASATRVLLINAAVFGGFLAFRALALRAQPSREAQPSLRRA